MHQIIGTKIKAETGMQITAAHCENRWRYLERMYNKTLTTERGRRYFEYANLIGEILVKSAT